MNRYINNPIITPDMVVPSRPGYRVRGAFNPGACMYMNETLLLVRVAEDCEPQEGQVAVPYYSFKNEQASPEILEVKTDDPDVQLKDTRGIVYKGADYLSTMSHIRLARSSDGINFTVDEAPFLSPCNESEAFGIEDARVTFLNNTYYINYTVVSKDGYATALATTQDFVNVERKGIIFPPQNKDVSIFPEKIDGKYYALQRPDNNGFGLPSLWQSESLDLIHWGNHHCIARPRNILWEEQKIGGGAAPIKTKEGWLEIYHGKGRNQIYSLFILLLDSNDPTKVLKRGTVPILKPEASYETHGFFPNVVFSNGIIQELNGALRIYYGACDECCCIATTTVNQLLKTLGL
ncbi:MAG: glycoside hydrolase family 130 protein [Fibrobacteria bacterium]|nr:glycoside hydrolase family 130 protein [Fibrobacteria bacterium]